MKIEQKAEFTSITITLETKEEALTVRDAVRAEFNSPDPCHIPGQRAILRQLSDWFSNSAKL